MAANRNRTAGHNWERTCVKFLHALGYHNARTSRLVSKNRDDCKVDLANADEDEFGRLPYNIQCKSLSTSANYRQLLEELDKFNGSKRINVVFHQMTEKSGKRFMERGRFALLKLKDFRKMMALIKGYEMILHQLGVELEFYTKNKLHDERHHKMAEDGTN